MQVNVVICAQLFFANSMAAAFASLRNRNRRWVAGRALPWFSMRLHVGRNTHILLRIMSRGGSDSIQRAN